MERKRKIKRRRIPGVCVCAIDKQKREKERG